MVYDGRVKVGFGSMDAAAAGVRTVAGAVAGDLDALKQYLAPLVSHSEWSGGASDEYAALQAQWDAAAEDLLRVVLPRIAHVLDIANGNYIGAERTNAGIWGGGGG